MRGYNIILLISEIVCSALHIRIDKQPNIGYISYGKSNTICKVIGEITVPLLDISSLFKRPGNL